jgi:hypothetical protein
MPQGQATMAFTTQGSRRASNLLPRRSDMAKIAPQPRVSGEWASMLSHSSGKGRFNAWKEGDNDAPNKKSLISHRTYRSFSPNRSLIDVWKGHADTQN